MSSYPVVWEYDSPNITDRTGKEMHVYSTDFNFADNKPFYTFVDINNKVPTQPVGDALGVVLFWSEIALLPVRWLVQLGPLVERLPGLAGLDHGRKADDQA